MIFGILVILIGVICCINVLVPELNIDFSILIAGVILICSLTNMIKNKKFDFFSGFLTFGSIWYILIELDILKDDLKALFFPIILIIMGISIILESKSFKDKRKVPKVEKKEQMNYNALFAGIEEKVKGKNFKGCKIYSIFGGTNLDLREIEIEQDIVIEAYSIFGGTEILLPKDYKVVLNSTAILGGNENKAISNEKGTHTIFVNAISIFGGCDLK